MPTFDDFVRPKEWVPEWVSDLGKALRIWGEERYIPVRQQIDEDWQEHALVKPLLKEVLVDMDLSAAFFPAEVGGLDMTEAMTVSNVECPLLVRPGNPLGGRCWHLHHSAAHCSARRSEGSVYSR